MKFALISHTSSSIFNFRIEFLKSLVSSGFEVYCFATDFSYDDEIKLKNMNIIPIDYNFRRGGLNPISDICNTLFLARKIRKIKPDIVFSTFSKPVIFGTLAAKLACVPRVYGMLEGLGATFTKTGKKELYKTKLIRFVQIFLYHLSIPFLEKIIFLNEDDPIDLIKKYKIRAKKIGILGGIGVDLDKFFYSEPNISNVSFIFIGRLLREKGIFEFLDAAKKIKLKYKNIEIKILGDFDFENPGSLSQKDLLKYQDLDFKGNTKNVIKELISSSVFVLPSYREGVPRSTQEAMAIGRPIITTDAIGCRDTIIDGVNGFKVPRFDVSALVLSMEKFILDPTLIVKMGMNSRQLAEEKFNVHIVNKRFFKLLDLSSFSG